MLRKLEDKITAKLLSRIENIVVKKCKPIFEEKKSMIIAKQQFKQSSKFFKVKAK